MSIKVMIRLGIFGGTFNPIHWGHLLLAETAREAYTLDRVLFVPTWQPPHKTSRGLLPGSVRFKLVELAIHDHPSFVASDIELKRGGTSYTIDTVKTLKKQLPNAQLFLLVGQDLLGVRWLAWEEIKRLCTVVVAHRPGFQNPKRPSKVKWLQMPPVAITSSEIRKRVQAGRSIRYLVPTTVERYIQQHQLYQQGRG